MSDIFNEVDSEVRTARFTAFISQAWPYALGAVALAGLLLLGVWGWGKHQQSQAVKASETYAQGLDALAHGDTRGAETHFAAVARSAPPAYKALALMQQAGLRVTQGKDADAIALLDQAAKAASDPVLADSASLRAAFILMDKGAGTGVETRLTPLAAADRPFHWIAREALGMARLQAGRPKEARSDFSVLTLATDVSEATRTRARAAIALIDDGAAAALPSIVKTAGALPPTPTPLIPAGAAQ